MKKPLLLLTLLLGFYLSSTAQDSGKIEYEIKLDSDFINEEELEKKKNLGFINDALNEHIEKFSFSLVFNVEESLFSLQEQMSSDHDSRSFKIAKALIEAGAIYYLNTKTNVSLKKFNAYGQNIIIKDSILSSKWELTKESKEIDNYKCYKAITTKIVTNSKGTFKTKVIAWYTPDLAFNFGAKGYGGLPGMILELKDDKFVYYATKIKLKMDNSVEIKKPKKGKLMTQAEFTEFEKNTDSGFRQN